MHTNDYEVNKKSGRITYFNRPTQVKFYDQKDGDEEIWLGGIGVEDYVICGECGCTIELDDIYDAAEFDHISGEPVQVLNWVGISDIILGE